MSRAQNKEKKLAVLQVVKEQKNVLFGCFQNNAASKLEKEKAWKDVLKKAQSLGLASANRDWTYARDHIFGLWKSRTLAKINNSRQTSPGSGKAAVLDAVDEAILEIIGTDSPAVQGLCLPEADGIAVTAPPKEKQNSRQPQSFQNRSSIKRKADDSDSIEFLKQQVLESELYKNRLEILKLERELSLTPSELTKDLQSSRGKVRSLKMFLVPEL